MDDLLVPVPQAMALAEEAATGAAGSTAAGSDAEPQSSDTNGTFDSDARVAAASSSAAAALAASAATGILANPVAGTWYRAEAVPTAAAAKSSSTTSSSLATSGADAIASASSHIDLKLVDVWRMQAN
jgi:hypothetical protein